MLLLVVPALFITLLVLTDHVAPGAESIWSMPFTFIMFTWMAFLNISFIMKLHCHRIGAFAKAEKWKNAPIWFSVAIMSAVLVAK